MKTLDRLLHAALTALETGEWPDASTETEPSEAEAEEVFRACASILEAHGCPVEVSPWPSWEEDAQPFPGQEERSGGEFDRKHGVWVNCRLGSQARAVAIIHEAAHFFDFDEGQNSRREVVAYLAGAVACFELGVLSEPSAVKELAGGLCEAADREYGWWPAEEALRYVRPLLDDPVPGRAARIAEKLVRLINAERKRLSPV